MSNFTKTNKNIAISIIFIYGLTGCATNGAGPSFASGAESGGCNPAAMAAFGAILGALAAGKNNQAQGAVAGAAIGGLACVAWNYRSEQTKTAQQVNQAFKSANNGQLPVEPRLLSYSIYSVPSATINSGSPLVLNSTMAVVDGTNGIKPVVEQEMTVFHAGKVVSNLKKVANSGSGAGEYKSEFTVKLPQGVPQGDYPVRTSVYLNGVKVQERNLSVQVVGGFLTENLASLTY
jgi:hypothetical protein